MRNIADDLAEGMQRVVLGMPLLHYHRVYSWINQADTETGRVDLPEPLGADKSHRFTRGDMHTGIPQSEAC